MISQPRYQPRNKAEEDLMQDGMNVQADILKVGHHGSRTASGQVY
jgi:beta-lactamase superfamily II metal-dependent hydrolase